MGKERFLKEVVPYPKAAETSNAAAEATKGDSKSGDKKPSPPNEEHSDVIEAESEASQLTKEATKPMDNAKLRAELKAEVLKELNLKQRLSNLSEQERSEHQAQIAEVKAEIAKLRQELSQSRETIKELRAEIETRTHTTSDLRKAIKAEEEAEAEKPEPEKPKGMRWPLSIFNK